MAWPADRIRYLLAPSLRRSATPLRTPVVFSVTGVVILGVGAELVGKLIPGRPGHVQEYLRLPGCYTQLDRGSSRQRNTGWAAAESASNRLLRASSTAIVNRRVVCACEQSIRTCKSRPHRGGCVERSWCWTSSGRLWFLAGGGLYIFHVNALRTPAKRISRGNRDHNADWSNRKPSLTSGACATVSLARASPSTFCVCQANESPACHSSPRHPALPELESVYLHVIAVQAPTCPNQFFLLHRTAPTRPCGEEASEKDTNYPPPALYALYHSNSSPQARRIPLCHLAPERSGISPLTALPGEGITVRTLKSLAQCERHSHVWAAAMVRLACCL